MAHRATLLWGARSQARLVESILKTQQTVGTPTLIFDPTLQGCSFPTKVPFSNDADELLARAKNLDSFVVCIGGYHGFARSRISETLIALGLQPLSVQHWSAVVDETCQVAPGIQVLPGVVVNGFSSIGAYTILGSNSTVEHESVLGVGVHIYPGAVVAGLCRVEDFATVGLSAVVFPRVCIGRGAVVLPGAVVHEDVAPFTQVAGNPARVVGDVDHEVDERMLELILRA